MIFFRARRAAKEAKEAPAQPQPVRSLFLLITSRLLWYIDIFELKISIISTIFIENIDNIENIDYSNQ